MIVSKNPIATVRLLWVTCVLIGMCSQITSCGRSFRENVIVVRVLRDSKSGFSKELDRTLYAFNTNHRIRSGKMVFVATVEGDYKKQLTAGLSQLRPQMVILDSAADATLTEPQLDLQNAKNACGPTSYCPAIIPPWVTGEELEAASMLLSAISENPASEPQPIPK